MLYLFLLTPSHIINSQGGGSLYNSVCEEIIEMGRIHSGDQGVTTLA